MRDLLDRAPHTLDDYRAAGLLRGRRVCITGAGGTIGSELCRIVDRYEPRSLVMVERSEAALFAVDRELSCPRVPVLIDCGNREAMLACFRHERPEVVIHAAAHKHVPMSERNILAAIENNVHATAAVLDAAREVGAGRFVLISTDKAVAPVSVMGATKWLAERYVRGSRGIPAGIVRFGNVLGSSGSVLEIWHRQLARGEPLTVTDPDATRYFMTIEEAAALVVHAAGLVEAGEPRTYVLDMGEPVRMGDLAARLGGRVEYTGLRPGERLHERLHDDTEELTGTACEGVLVVKGAAICATI
jgi:FlaA1/EpsC-like NDP-sugar epimerase